MINSKVYCKFKWLESRFNPDASRIINDKEKVSYIILDQDNTSMLSVDTQVEPTNYEQSWNYNDPKDQERWRMGIKKESNEMDTKKFCEKVKKEDIPKGRRTIKCKWIFEIKRNGNFRFRCRFQQNFAPVIKLIYVFSPP
jgi:hypothetical protein